MNSPVHRINAAFGVSKAFVPYRPDYSKTTEFTVAESSDATIENQNCIKVGKVVTFSMDITLKHNLAASTTMAVGTFPSLATSADGALCTFIGRKDTAFISAYMLKLSTELRIRSASALSQGDSVNISGSYIAKDY